MDMANQNRIKEVAEKFSSDQVVVILGGAEAEACGLSAETVMVGDPTFAGPLTGIELKLTVFHIFELKELIVPAVYEEQIGLMEMVLDVDGIVKEMERIRKELS